MKRRLDGVVLMHEDMKAMGEDRAKRLKMDEEGALEMKRGLELDNQRRLSQARIETILNRDKLFRIGKSQRFIDKVFPLDSFLLEAEDLEEEECLKELL